MLFFILFSPLLLLNALDYKINLRKKPFYKSKIVALMEDSAFIFNAVTFFLHFPLCSKVYHILPDLSGKVLHVGCGTGLLNRYCRKRKSNNTKMFNLDTNINLLRHGLKKKIFQSYICASICNTPLEDEFFDIIVFARSFHHIRNHKKAFRECARLLKKNGVIIIIEPVSLSVDEKSGSYMTNTYIDGIVWRFSKTSFKEHLKANLAPDLTLRTVKYVRQKHITNYNLIYPHTDGLAIIEKSSNL